MIISFGFNGAGGGGGTSDYSQLSNKPQINGVTLNGNQSSSDLGITSEALEPVSSIPSGASVGDVYAVSKSQTVGYGWEEIENGYAFNLSLNPASGSAYVEIGQFVGTSDDTIVYIHSNTDDVDWPGYCSILGDAVRKGFKNTFTFDGGTATVNYFDYDRIEITFDGTSVPELQNPIASASTTVVDKKAVQVEDLNGQLGHFNYGSSYQGRYDHIMFWLDENGKKDFIPNTVVALQHYYEIYIKLFTNETGKFCIDYSEDSGVTWEHYLENCDVPTQEPDYYPLELTDPNNKSMYFKAWMAAGDGNYGIHLRSNKSMWIDNNNIPYGITVKPLIKEGDSYESLSSLPQINGVELKGNQSLSDFGITFNELLAKEGYLYQKEFNGLAVSSYEDINVFSVDWDGESDMTLSLALENIWEITAKTPYYSGGTWYNITGLRDYPEPDYGGLYSCGYSNGKFVCEFNKDFTITGVSVGSITSAVTFYKDINSEYRKGDVVNLRYEDAHSDNWITFVPGASRNVKVTNSTGGVLAVNYGNNLQESIEIDSSGEYVDTTGWIAEGDHYFKYTPDMGKLMILHSSGDFYWEISGGNENLYINNPDVNGIAGNYSMKLHYSSMVGPYIYNGFFWEKLV